jgi:hypothetical protein
MFGLHYTEAGASFVKGDRFSDWSEFMVITVEPELEAALNELANRQGVPPEVLAVNALRERFLVAIPPGGSQDEWERRLRAVAIDCSVSLSDEAVGSEGLYD